MYLSELAKYKMPNVALIIMYVNFVLIILYFETIPNDIYFMGESCVHIYAVRKSGEMFKIVRYVQYLIGFAFGAVLILVFSQFNIQYVCLCKWEQKMTHLIAIETYTIYYSYKNVT